MNTFEQNNMHQFVLNFHSHFLWLILFSAVAALLLPFAGSRFSSKSKLPALFFMICCDIQLLMGLLLYFSLSPLGIQAFKENEMSVIMKTPGIRKITIEHLVLMLLGILFVHLGYSKIKRATEQSEVRKLTLKFMGIAIVLFLLGIPWFRVF